jgi:HSP20 family protein
MKFPAVDIEETEKAFLIKADLPGLKKEDIKITIEDNQLTISGERSKTEKSETEHYKHFERLQGSFSRSFLLPDSINEENVSAKYENGVLMLTVKKVPSRDATEIKIE